MRQVEYKDRTFFVNGEKTQILSGGMHYFRTIPELWEDRLLKLKACGFNTVETYIPWNLHEPEEGVFDFEGIADLVAFIKKADELDLMVIIRPGPYICAEWDFGGLPGWIMNDDKIKLRTYNKPFFNKVKKYLKVIIDKLKPLQWTTGGPVIAVQVENEYGSYGNDKVYLNEIRNLLIDEGIDVILFTSDGPTDLMLQGGTLPDVLKTVNFGSKALEAFELLKHYEADGPLMCMEYWIGWFDHWGDKHHARDYEEVIENFEQMLMINANVNFYMFHGGTNFGFKNGCNYQEGVLQPTTTSYDYDALLTEWGDMTDKYFAVQEVLKKRGYVSNLAVSNSKKIGYGKVKMVESMDLLEQVGRLSNPVRSQYILPMEKLQQYDGLILYRTQISDLKGKHTITVKDCHDRGIIYLDGIYQGTIDRTKQNNNQVIELEFTGKDTTLDILVENLGRINYGPDIGEFKGITEGVLIDYQYHFGWEIYSLPLQNLNRVCYTKNKGEKGNSPTFYKGNFEVEEVADTFIDMGNWTKGLVFINGFNLGRFWNIGPQRTLYVPSGLLHEGSNCIEVLELHHVDDVHVEFIDEMKYI